MALWRDLEPEDFIVNVMMSSCHMGVTMCFFKQKPLPLSHWAAVHHSACLLWKSEAGAIASVVKGEKYDYKWLFTAVQMIRLSREHHISNC